MKESKGRTEKGSFMQVHIPLFSVKRKTEPEHYVNFDLNEVKSQLLFCNCF